MASWPISVRLIWNSLCSAHRRPSIRGAGSNRAACLKTGMCGINGFRAAVVGGEPRDVGSATCLRTGVCEINGFGAAVDGGEPRRRRLSLTQSQICKSCPSVFYPNGGKIRRTSEKIRFHYPHHIAKLYEFLQLEQDARLRTLRLLDFYEAVLRYMALGTTGVGLPQVSAMIGCGTRSGRPAGWQRIPTLDLPGRVHLFRAWTPGRPGRLPLLRR